MVVSGSAKKSARSFRRLLIHACRIGATSCRVAIRCADAIWRRATAQFISGPTMTAAAATTSDKIEIVPMNGVIMHGYHFVLKVSHLCNGCKRTRITA